jgi:L,D-transpeptidase catalytic domain
VLHYASPRPTFTLVSVKRQVAAVVVAVALVAGAVTASVVALRSASSGDTHDDGSALAAVATEVGAASLPPRAIGEVREPEPGYLGAQAAVTDVDLYPTAEATTPMWSLPSPTHEGVTLSFTVLDRVGSRLHVRLPIRPNGSTAWIDASQVISFVVPNHLVVDLSDRRLTAYHGDEVLLESAVAVGAPATPTPIGDFYVDISVSEPGGSYGAWMLSVAGFSNVLTSFGGGIGQIAIHGWSDESVMGQAVSNGCIRMSNGVISRLAGLAPVGTPVTVRA